MDNLGNEQTCRIYNRHRYEEQEMHCQVDKPNRLIGRIFDAIGMDYSPQEDEWKWEEYLDEVNRRIQNKMGKFYAACFKNGIPKMYVNLYCDRKELTVYVKMSIISFPSNMYTGALFDWIKDFVLGAILSPDNGYGPIRIRLADRNLTVQEVGLISGMLETLNRMDQSVLYVVEDQFCEEETAIFVDLDDLNVMGETDYVRLSEKLRQRYPYSHIKAYTSGVHRGEWREIMAAGMELVNVLESPRGQMAYDSSYKLAIDATDAITRSGRIVVVSSNRNLISLCFAVHRRAKKIDFILPDTQSDINYVRHADRVLDRELKEYSMEGRE